MLSVEFLADAVRIYGSTARLVSPHTNFNVVIRRQLLLVKNPARPGRGGD